MIATYDFGRLYHYLNYYPPSFAWHIKNTRHSLVSINIIEIYHKKHSIKATDKEVDTILKIIYETYQSSNDRVDVQIDFSNYMRYKWKFMEEYHITDKLEPIIITNYVYDNFLSQTYPTEKSVENFQHTVSQYIGCINGFI